MRGKFIYLEPYTIDDRDKFIDLITNESVMEYVGGALDYDSADEIFDEILANETDDNIWAIRHAQNNEYVGHASLRATESIHVKEIIIYSNEQFWGYGYGTEVGQLLVSFAQSKEEIEEVYMEVDPASFSGQRICQKLNFEDTMVDEDEEGDILIFRRPVKSEAIG